MTRQTPIPDHAAQDRTIWSVIRLSAATAEDLEAATRALHDRLRQDVAARVSGAVPWSSTSDSNRHRRVVICRDAADAVKALDKPHPRTVKSSEVPATSPKVCFMFPGGAAQYAGMAGELYRTRPVFAEQVDACADLFAEEVDLDVRDALTPSDEPSLTSPVLGLSSLFTVEYALARLWQSLGVWPAALIGHSLGEYAAATLAGVLSLPDAVRLVAHRARLIAGLPAGMMLTVAAPEREVVDSLEPGIDVAAVNAPGQIVVSGPTALVDALEPELTARGIKVRRLHIVAGGHSSLVDGILPEFERIVASVTAGPPEIPCISNVTGDWLSDAQAIDPTYWVRHLRAPVRFADGIRVALSSGPLALLEVGPGTTLSTLALQNGATEPAPISSLRHPLDPRTDTAMMVTAMAELWLAGIDIDWAAWGD